MRELDSGNGIGLIEKKRRGLGKLDIIYVKNFTSTEVKDFNFKKQKNLTSGSKKIELQEVKESDLKREKI